jgi:hypothetical protein
MTGRAHGFTIPPTPVARAHEVIEDADPLDPVWVNRVILTMRDHFRSTPISRQLQSQSDLRICVKKRHHSITPLARARSVSVTVKPAALTILKLTTNSKTLDV